MDTDKNVNGLENIDKIKDINYIPKWFSQDNDQWIFRNVDGRITNYFVELQEKLKKKNMTVDHFRSSNKPYFARVFEELSRMEHKIDKYEELLKMGLQNNNHFLFPNFGVNYDDYGDFLAERAFLTEDILAEKRYTKNIPDWQIKAHLAYKGRFGPHFSKESTELSKKLTTINYEDIQILFKHMPRAFDSAKTERYPDLKNAFDLYIYDNVGGLYAYEIGSKIISDQNLIPLYFKELNLKSQREERFQVGRNFLYNLFEEAVDSAKRKPQKIYLQR